MKKTNRFIDFTDFKFSLGLTSGLSVTEDVLKEAFKAFTRGMKKHPNKRKSKFIQLWLRIEYLVGESKTPQMLTLSGLVTYSFKSDLSTIINHFHSKAILKNKGDGYNDITLLNLVFHYKLVKDVDPAVITNFGNLIDRSKEEISKLLGNVNSLVINDLPVPITTNIIKWGTAISSIKNISEIKMPDTEFIFKITNFPTYNHIILYSVINDDNILLEFKDFFGINETTFVRQCKNQEFYYVNSEIDVCIKDKPTKFFRKPKNKPQKLSSKFLTLDIETKNVGGVLTPVVVGIASKNNTWAFTINKFRSADHMLTRALKSIMIPSNDNAMVYIHNMANFDIVFLLNSINNLKFKNLVIEPLIRFGLTMSITISWTVNDIPYSITLSDSYLLLPASLRKLGIAFNTALKGHFPFKFMDSIKNPMLFEGIIPNISFYPDITNEEYLELKNVSNNKWNLSNELSKYCMNDCRTLWQIIDNFNKTIHTEFEFNIFKNGTIPSLSLALFTRKFWDNTKKIPVITGEVYDFIKQSFTGGHTDVYIPYGENLYQYDVNSLYPFIMANKPMPCGNVRFFTGDIFKVDPDAFGFFKVEITAPEHMDRPVVQTRLLTNGGIRTVSPVGTWTDVLFSEEIKAYVKYGYKFRIIEGYLFEQHILFNKYIKFWYEVKRKHNPSDVMYYIAKLMLNSLFGKFGLNPYLPENVIVDLHEECDFINNPNIEIENIINFGNRSLIQYHKLDQDRDDVKFKVSISISSAITAYARIYMAQFLQDHNINIYYTDTDSIIVDKPLPAEFVGKELGQFKLECIYEEAVFLAPKVYGGIIRNDDGTTRVVSKVKGYKDFVDYETLKSLLDKDNVVNLTHEKWFKDPVKSTIIIKESVYKLMVTESKRVNLYLGPEFYATLPFRINNDRQILNKSKIVI